MKTQMKQFSCSMAPGVLLAPLILATGISTALTLASLGS